tara:strand:+ start:166 stop:417 length:252 start_codon:yes stop_codon:yes gene_type:complete
MSGYGPSRGGLFRHEAKGDEPRHGELIAHLDHEGLMDMKPILNRGTGKRLRGNEMRRNEEKGVAKRSGEMMSRFPSHHYEELD